LANRLSEDERTEVLLLEAGGTDLSPFIQLPAAMAKLPKKYDWQWEAEPDPSRSGRVEHWGGGRVLGGSSSINGQIWTRGNRGDFEEWAELGAVGWDYDSVLPYFRRTESFEAGESAIRGGHGLQSVAYPRVHHRMTDVFIDAAMNRGHRFNPDFNGLEQAGIAHAQLSQRRGFRQSAARSYLEPARRRKNLKVLTKATARRVLFDGDVAAGVEFLTDGRVEQARVRGEVVLSAGVIATPRLLLLSGVGPADDLGQLGIPLVSDSPNVGRNFQDHLFTSMIWTVNVPTLNMELHLKGYLKHGADFLLHGRGAVTAPVGHALVFGRTQSDKRDTEYEIMFSPLGLESVIDSARNASHDIHDVRMATVSSVLCAIGISHPKARGRVSLRSADPDDPPRIEHQLAGKSEDVALMTAVCRHTREILGADPFRPYITGEMLPGPGVQSEEEWKQFISRTAIIGQHPIGTCRMGQDAESVVDQYLRVRNLGKLRVVDASVMPTLVCGHTSAPTMMIAERAAEFIRTAAMASGDAS
jgi:choline dehydrogenase